MKTFKDLVKERGLTHEQIARKLKARGTPLARSYITKIINGTKTPPERTMKLLLDALDCELISHRVAVKIEDGKIKEQYHV